MTEKRYFLHKHLGRDAIHDTICHNWLQREELEEHMNVQYTKYSTLKKENEQLKSEIKDFQELLTGKEEELLKPIRITIQEAYQTERTSIGKSVLKQLMESLE